jgi:hypothetical protein
MRSARSEMLQQALLVFDLEGKMGGHRVGQLGGSVMALTLGQILGDVLVDLGVFLEGFDGPPRASVRLRQHRFVDGIRCPPGKSRRCDKR